MKSFASVLGVFIAASYSHSCSGARSHVKKHKTHSVFDPGETSTPWRLKELFSLIGVSMNVQSSNDYVSRVWNALGNGQILEDESATVALICLQEAPTWESGLPDFLKASLQHTSWRLLDHTQNNGMTGRTEYNHQSLSILVRPPPGSKNVWLNDTGIDKDGRHCLSFQDGSNNAGAHVCIMMATKKTSWTGKGSAMALIDFVRGDLGDRWRPTLTFRLAVACAHLGANTDKERDAHTSTILDGLDSFNLNVRQDVVPYERLGIDGQIFMGDLNYRFRQSTLGHLNRMMIVNSILQHLRGSNVLTKADPLGKSDLDGNKEVGGKALRGLLVRSKGFTCNTPKYLPPTYKLMDAAACRAFFDCAQVFGKLSSATKKPEAQGTKTACGGTDIGQDMFDLASACYSGQGLDQMMEARNMTSAWGITKGRSGDKMQLGWLDRVCWKTTDRNFQNFIAEEDVEFAKRMWHAASAGSTDHLPVVAKLRIQRQQKPI
eukprot:TRINITY_DN16835_c0_g5_i1.p1 TRINITY_DN16835_c0_g5~~TRINITY_DN16835_c0_g5_i1.p1  ORF type:complete len:490 (+),score=51.11 TRINITY_DN16835_c0_g5_i1:76-1545(+)